jgi:hypothetical protein
MKPSGHTPLGFLGLASNRIVAGHDEEIAKWVAERVPWAGRGDFGPMAALGVVSDTGLIAGVVYHDYQPDHGTIQLSMAAASPMWARRENLRALLHYPFRRVGVFKAWIATPHDHAHGIKTFEHIGFKREAILAHQFGRKRHAWIGRMLQPDFHRIYETD